MIIDKTAWIGISALFVTSIITGAILSKTMKDENPFTDKGLLKKGAYLPPIWLFYNSGDVNGRAWADFGARSSRVLNVPYLNLAYEAIVRHNSANYRVEVINGIAGLAELLGWEAIPEPMRTTERSMNSREMDWIRAAVLARFGGLWLEPSSACVRGFGSLPTNKIVFFGTDLDEPIAGSGGTRIPGMRAVWAGRAGHPIFNAWAADAYERVCGTIGGFVEAAEKAEYMKWADGADDVIVNVAGECGRGFAQKRIELDDLLVPSEDGRIPFAITKEAIFVPVPWRELLLRRSLAWFLVLTEEEIMESELVIKVLLEV